jgi:hypothetical protein
MKNNWQLISHCVNDQQPSMSLTVKPDTENDTNCPNRTKAELHHTCHTNGVCSPDSIFYWLATMSYQFPFLCVVFPGNFFSMDPRNGRPSNHSGASDKDNPLEAFSRKRTSSSSCQSANLGAVSVWSLYPCRSCRMGIWASRWPNCMQVFIFSCKTSIAVFLSVCIAWKIPFECDRVRDPVKMDVDLFFQTLT